MKPILQATSSPQDVTHAAALLAYLNHQRDQGIFCDCVLRQGQNSDQLYHAHRCILAASSPVLASILSSSGALVELHDPSLSDSVLPSLLDYIYTGVLPCPLSEQEHYRLLSAACQMQMKELQDALRANWLQIQGNAEDDKNAPVIVEMYSFKETEDSCKTDFETFKHLPSSTTACNFQSHEATRHSLLNEIFQEPRVTSDDSPENDERKIKNQHVNGHTRTDLAAFNDLNTFGILGSIDKDNAGDDRQVTSPTQRKSLRSKDEKTLMHDLPGVDVHHSPNFVKPDMRQRTPEEDLLRRSKERKGRSSSPSSSPSPCSEAVPVICHSSRVAVLQQSEDSVWPHSEASQSFVQPPSKIADFSLSSGIGNDNSVEAITTECKDQNGAQSQDPRSTISHISCATDHKVDKDYNSSNVHLFKFNNTCENASNNMNNNNQTARLDSLQSHTEYYGEYVVQSNVSRRGLKHQIERDYDPVPSKNQHFDCCQCQRTLLTTSTQEQSIHQGAAVSLLMEVEDTGSASPCEECLEVEVKRGPSYSSICLDVTDMKTNHCKTSGPITDWYTKMHKDDKSRKDISDKVSSTQTKFRFITSQSGLTDVTDSFSASKCGKVVERRKNSSSENTEPCSFVTAPLDHNFSGTTRTSGQLNHRHLSHQGEPCDDASLQDLNHKHLKPCLSPDSNELGDEVNTPFSGKRSLSQHFLIETEDQPDINTKHDELPVSCQHGHHKEEKQFVVMDSAAILSPDDAQANQDSSVARAERLDEADGQRDVKKRNPFDIKLSQAGPCVTQNISVMEVSKPEEHETKSSSTPVCSPLGEPECDRASKPSTASVCIPSTRPACMPTDRSAHLSSPSHQPFQCSLCDRSFSQRGSLNRHVRSHLGVRPFPCPCCPMTFSRQYRVTEHMRVHQRSALGNGLQKSSVIKD
ncbi:hypermethylated in cancer 2 protein-like [Poeciliopsis prolifica]|uniref:hypermethylated in cancer 2 protein-like n=1 Tax=Poeciliopsis prolifica TaxID=188132 RepID=UPI00241329E2|nr:hypermethylated in cancer 2 protein-like [Poeciliopsis prolifica]